MKTQRGYTLLETLLVLAVASMIVMISLKYYSEFQLQSQAQQLRANVEQLFQGASNYYYANCSTSAFTPSGSSLSPIAVSTGTLQSGGYIGSLSNNALVNSSATTSYTTSTTTTSTTNCTKSGSWWVASCSPSPPCVTTGWFFFSYSCTAPPTTTTTTRSQTVSVPGYIIQFNPSVATSVKVQACTVLSPGTACTIGSASLPTTQAKSINMQMQVAVAFKNNSQAALYKKILGADCISDINPTSIQTIPPAPATYTCSDTNNTGTGSFLVWTRLPSFASPATTSILWPSLSISKQLDLQYTHDQMYELNSGYTHAQNYLCGS